VTDALTYLTEHHVMTLATQGTDGPWAAAVFYVNDGYTLFFLSSPKSRHAVDMALHRRVAATVQEDYADWTRIRGVQLEGVVRELAGIEAARARERYGAKFAVIAEPPPPIAAALAKVHWYELVPQRMHFVDNTIAFGHRTEVRL
jgi:hypothetical protein